MLLSRFWYFVLAVAAASAAVATLLAQTAFDREAQAELVDDLLRDRFEVELLLRVDARARLDALAPIAAHPRIRGALDAAGRAEPDEATKEALRGELRSLNKQLDELAGDLLFAVDHAGVIVAFVGAARPPAGASLGAFPLVERALGGYVRDDVWIFNDAVYRMAARPVIEGGRYVGAIVHGKRFDDELTERLGSRLGDATVAFFRDEQVFAAHVPGVVGAPSREALAGPLRSVVDGEAFRDGERSEPVALGERAEAIFSPVTGSAASAGVGYVVARPRVLLGSPFAVFERVTREDVAALPWVLIGLGAVLLLAIGLLLTWVERDRPLRALARDLGQVASGALDRLSIAAFSGAYRAVADRANEALDGVAKRSGAVSAARSPQDLDAILGPTPEGTGTPFFGFQSGDTEPPQPAAAAPQPEAAAPRPQAAARPATPEPTAAGPRPAPGTSDAAHAPGLNGAGPAKPRLPPSPFDPLPPATAEASPGSTPEPTPVPDGPAEAREGAAAPAAPPPPPPAAGAAPPPLPAAPPAKNKATIVGMPAQDAFAAIREAAQRESERARARRAADDEDAIDTGAPPEREGAPTRRVTPPPARFDEPGAAESAAPTEAPRAAHAALDAQDDDEDEDGDTRIADVPEFLRQGAAATRADAPDDEDDGHFRSVFEDFVRTKTECGEATGALDYEKFAKTLRKNRDQIIAKHGAKSVRFTVYVKGSKAALKATPIRQ